MWQGFRIGQTLGCFANCGDPSAAGDINKLLATSFIQGRVVIPFFLYFYELGVNLALVTTKLFF
jgi:hypothetical protein